jgi:hypothetical protein
VGRTGAGRGVWVAGGSGALSFLISFSLSVYVGVPAGVGSLDCDVCDRGSFLVGVGRLGGGGTTMAKLGLGLRGLSKGFSALVVAVAFFGVGDLDLAFDSGVAWLGGPIRVTGSRRARTSGELGGMCFTIMISWSSSPIAMGSGEDAVERPPPRGAPGGGALF